MMPDGFYNMDCLSGMKEFPDNYFDLAIVDPPYGSASGDEWQRFGGRFDKYKGGVEPGSGDISRSIDRTGRTWAKAYGKKLLRGTRPRPRSILTNSSVFHANKSYGAGITLIYRQHGVLSCGKRPTFQTGSAWHKSNMRGVRSGIMPKYIKGNRAA